jgi:hypothetical protein
VDFGVLKTITMHYDHAKVLTQTAEQLAAEIGAAALKQLAGQDNAQNILEVRVAVWETSNCGAEWIWHVQDQ